MSIPRIAAAALASLLLAAGLSGCASILRPVEARTQGIAHALDEMPGVASVEISVKEFSLGWSLQSSVWVEIDPAATSEMVVELVGAFAAADARAGRTPVTTQLHVASETDHDYRSDRLHLDLHDSTDAQRAALVEAWFTLREHHESVTITLTDSTAGNVIVTEVALSLFDDVPSRVAFDTVLDIQEMLAPLAPLQSYRGGGFTVTLGPPTGESIRLADALFAMPGVAGLAGDLHGLGGTSLTITTDETGLVGGGSVPFTSAILSILEPLPAGHAVSLEFETRAGEALGFFTNHGCRRYEQLTADDPSRLLLDEWARDGAVWSDGSDATLCLV